MRYLKVLLAIVFFYIVMLFFVQNQEELSQTMRLRFDLFFLPPVETNPVSYYVLALVAFLIGGLCALAMLLWDRLTISAHLSGSRRKIKSLEKELEKSMGTLEEAKKELLEAVAKVEQAEARAANAELAAEKARADARLGGPVSFSNDLPE